jgi:Ni2+-binding GTPase involved in maturation of urease and hydrogenase
MRLVTVAGPPSVGKTSLFLKVAARLRDDGAQVGVVKFDALSTTDDVAYAALELPVRVGLSAGLCPDHFFVSNIDDAPPEMNPHATPRITRMTWCRCLTSSWRQAVR